MKKNRRFFEKRIGGSFHYQNKWMDKYAWDIRSNIFFREVPVEMRKVVDIGCGDGRWGLEFIRRKAIDVMGIEQSKKLARNTQILSTVRDMGDPHFKRTIRGRDLVTAITVMNFIVPRGRRNAVKNIRSMLSKFGTFAMIDYLPEVVPDYQRDKDYKEVWSLRTWLSLIQSEGFFLIKIVDINWIDTTIFHYLGGNIFTYAVTYILDRFLTPFKRDKVKYRLLMFTKV